MNRSFATLILLGICPCLSVSVLGQTTPARPDLKIPIGHVRKINAVAISPNSKYIATAGDDNVVILWDAASGTELKELTFPRSVRNVMFTPDSKNFVAAASDKGLFGRTSFYKCAVTAGIGPDPLPFQGDAKSYVSPSGQYFLVRGLVRRSDPAVIKEGLNATDTARLAQGSIPFLEWDIWDVAAQRTIYTYSNPGSEAAFISLDGREYLLTAGMKQLDYKKIQADMDRSGKEAQARIDSMQRIPDTSEKLQAATRNMQRLSQDPDGIGKNYNHAMMEQAMHPNSSKDSLAFYQVAYQKLRDSMMTYQSIIVQESSKKSMAMMQEVYSSRTKQEMTAFKPEAVMELWDFRQDARKSIRSFSTTYPVTILATATNGNLVATGDSKGDLDLWDLHQDASLRKLPKFDKKPAIVQLSGNGKFLLTLAQENQRQAISIWNTQDGSKIYSIGMPYQFRTNTIQFSPDGRFFVVIGDENVGDGNTGMLYTVNGKMVRKLERHADQVLAYHFSREGRYVYTDHNYFALPEEQRRQQYEDKKAILDKFRINSRNKSEAEVNRMREAMLQELNQYFRKQAKEPKGNRNMRVWDLELGNVVNFSPDSIVFTTDSVSPDRKHLLTSLVKKTAISYFFNGPADTVTADSWAKDGPTGGGIGDKVSSYIEHEIDVETKGTGIDLRKAIRDQNSEVNRTFSQKTLLINEDTHDTVTLVAIDSLDWIMVNQDGYYMCSKNGARELRYELNNQVYHFDQFDLQYNRPDKVLASIGIAQPNIIDAYRKAYERRVSRMGFDPAHFAKEITFSAPEIRIPGNKGVYDSSVTRTFTFTLEANDKQYGIKKIDILVNGVPEMGTKGYQPGDGKSQTVKEAISLELSAGKNVIEASAVNENGVSSLAERFEVDYTGPRIKPDLYVIAIGAGRYRDSTINLRYAEKDAADIVQFFGADTGFAHIHPILITGDNVTTEHIREVKKTLMKAGVDDRVILFYAGHGLLDRGLQYFLGTYGVDIKDPGREGLAYDKLEDLLDGIPPREKILLLDACYSGEIDKEGTATGPGSNTNKERGAIVVSTTNTGPQRISEIMNQLFNDIRHSTGATVISAAAGVEVAFEGLGQHNGAFTYCLLKGLREKKADLNQDGIITASELRSYVQIQVPLLTKGRQHPTSRTENTEHDIQVW